MNRTIRILTSIALVAVLGLTSFTVGQNEPGKKPKDEGEKKPKEQDRKPLKPGYEEEKIRDEAKDAFKSVETERDRFLERLRKLPPVPTRPGSSEADVWFDQLTGGGENWKGGENSSKSIRELFERVTADFGPRIESLTRAQFRQYFARYLVEGQSRPWKQHDPFKDREKAFYEQDRNGNGLLDLDELSPILAQERDRWDTNHDNAIDLNEYSRYFENRKQQVLLTIEPKQPKPSQPPLQPLPGEQPSRIEQPRPSLPPIQPSKPETTKLPKWFIEVDTDDDGQIGLYEWKHVDLIVAEFVAMDRNGDGFLTEGEILSFLKSHPAAPPQVSAPPRPR